MGAEMIIAHVERRHGRDESELLELIANLTPEEATRIFEAAEGDTWDGLYADDEIVDETELELVQRRLTEAVSAIFHGHREVTFIEIGGFGGPVVWLTGGPSWGDNPTEMFMPFSYLAEADII